MALSFVPLGSPSNVNVAAPAKTASLRGMSSAPKAYASQMTGEPSSGKNFMSAELCGASMLGVALGVTNTQHQKKRKNQKTRAMAFDPSVQEGVTRPIGFFDPLGFSKGKDEKGFRQLRIAETKHGRVAMMASIGLVMPHIWRFPGFEDVPSGVGAVFTAMGGAGLAVLVFGAGFHELVLWKDDESKDPGNFGDPFNVADMLNVERNYELNNGRMAMIAVLGEIVAELATGQDAVQQLGFGGAKVAASMDSWYYHRL